MNSDLNLQDYSILIVDDNPTNLGVIADYLEEYGFRMLTSRDGIDGIDKSRRAHPDLILLDVMMPPGIDGFETCRRLKADESTQEIPVIFMTALAGEEDKVKGFDAGGVDYVTKPVQQREVLARITTHLRMRKQAKQLQQQNESLSKLAAQLSINSEISQQVTSILDLNELLGIVVNLIQSQFGYYFVGIWLLDEQTKMLVLQANARRDDSPLTEVLPFSLDLPQSIIATVGRTGQDYLANEVHHDTNYLAVQELPHTRAELALPLRFGSKVSGVLDIQSDQPMAFTLDNKNTLQILANQIAIAIRNAQLYSLLNNANQELVKLNADKDKFFSIMAHDLKGPFMPLLGTAELQMELADTLTPPEVKQMGSSIYQSAKNIYSLLENLLQWSRLQMGRIEHCPTQLDLTQIVDQIVWLLTANAANKRITLQNTIDHVFIYADENMLNMVIRNLISNALKFTPSGGCVTISADFELPPINSEIKNSLVEVSIMDTGVGINPTDAAKLFKIDAHHSTVGTAKERGTGLGLILCKEMVEQNGGKIWVESELGKGTTVKFTVPLAEQQPSVEKRALVSHKPLAKGEVFTNAPTTLIAPPPEEMAVLLSLAMAGDMHGIKKESIKIKESGEVYLPFATKLFELATDFDEQEILTLIKRFMA